ncbi:MAG: xylose isomerase [Planctomycetaceae bacterium]|nr:xylose isomerase [Planctomycetaceae bacterium]
MARFSINEMTTYRWSFEEDVHHCAAAGIESIAVWRQKLSDFGEDKGVELLAESGVSVSSLLWAGGFTGSDGRSHKEAVADARDAIHLAAELNAECLIVYSGARAGHTQSHANRLLRTALTSLLPIACEFGIPLAIEPVPTTYGDGWSFLSSIDNAQVFLDEFDSPQLQLVFDTYHFGRDEKIAERLPDLASRIAIVQLADGKRSPRMEQNRCRLGEGTIPLATIISQLLRGGYDGTFDVKLMGEEIEVCDYAELVAHSKQVFDELTTAASV